MRIILSIIYIIFCTAQLKAADVIDSAQSNFNVEINISAAISITIYDVAMSDLEAGKKVKKIIKTNLTESIAEAGKVACFIEGTDYNQDTKLMTLTNTKEPHDSFTLSLEINNNCTEAVLLGKLPATAIKGSIYALTKDDLVIGTAYK